MLQTDPERGKTPHPSLFQADIHVGHLHQSILCTHLLHDIRRWPHLDALLADGSHAIIELLLVSAICLDPQPLIGRTKDNFNLADSWIFLDVLVYV